MRHVARRLFSLWVNNIMSNARAFCLLFSALSIAGLSGCVSGKRPISMAELCVGNEAGLSQFKALFEGLAKENNMKYIDNSKETAIELSAVKAFPSEQNAENHVINLGVVRRDGLGVMAGNVGLSRYQIAIGFSEGDGINGTNKFTADVVHRLRWHWRVDIIPLGTGALPMRGCN